MESDFERELIIISCFIKANNVVLYLIDSIKNEKSWKCVLENNKDLQEYIKDNYRQQC